MVEDCRDRASPVGRSRGTAYAERYGTGPGCAPWNRTAGSGSHAVRKLVILVTCGSAAEYRFGFSVGRLHQRIQTLLA
jgi:hypothetical protein